MKNNLSYYRHETGSHNHWKFKTLRRKHGWAGEGRFWALNNMIADSESCRLDMSDENAKASVAADLDLDPEEFDEFINYLVNSCKLVIEDEGSLFTNITQENLQEVNEKRNYQKNWKRDKSKSKTNISNSKTHVSNIENEQSKVKETKGKENKLNNIKGKESKTGDIDLGFENFWKLYGKEVGSVEKLKKKWQALTDHERKCAMDFIPGYKVTTPELFYRKNPETFLDNKSWNDALISKSQTNGHKQSTKIPSRRIIQVSKNGPGKF